ncbi:MAG: glycosyltransferase [Gracilibacteraceae bacterium]|nr:glycosyltransferase [Gracilibacteraceae bacterium]
MPKISVIMPVYNSGQYLPRAIDSVLGQILRDLELILVDDGSTDGSGQVCNRYARTDERVRVIRKPNGGTSSARNAGLAAVTGEYIAFADYDDYLFPEMYLYMYAKAEESGVDVVKCGTVLYDSAGLTPPWPKNESRLRAASMGQWNPVFNYHFPPDGTVLSSEEYLYAMLASQLDHAVWNLLIAASVGRDLRFPEGRFYEDDFFNLELAARASLLFVEKKLYVHTYSSVSSANSPASRRKLRVDASLNDIRKYLLAEQKGYHSLLPALFASVCRRLPLIMAAVQPPDLLDSGLTEDLGQITRFIDARQRQFPSAWQYPRQPVPESPIV